MTATVNGKVPGREVLSKPRARQEAARVLGIALQTRYRKFLDSASDDDATVVATADLAQCMYENVEFIIWALKSQGGMNPPPPEALTKISADATKVAVLAGDPRFQKPPEPVLDNPVPDECTCPPLEHGIIGRERHMTSCPKFKP